MTGTTIPANRYDINSLKRALKILELLAEEGKALGVTDLARRLAVDKSMVHRLLSTMASGGYIEQDEETRKYLLGLKVVQLAGMKLNSVQLLSTIKPYLRELATGTGDCAHLAVMVNREIIYLDKEDGDSMLTVRGGIGLKCPPHSTAVGKVLLAHLPEEELVKIVHKHGMPKYTETTILTLSDLKDELAQVRKLGYGWDNEETYVGVRCFAAPVRDHRGTVVASMGLSGPAQQLADGRIAFVTDLLIGTVTRASAKLGHAVPGSMSGNSALKSRFMRG